MSRIRIVGGTITKTTEGAHHMYSEENIIFNSNKTITEVGKEKGISYGVPKKAPLAPLLKKYFVEGWWSSDEAGDKRIKEALVGDHVYFHIKTKDIPNGGIVQMKLYDDDNNEKNEPKEKGKDNDDFKKMIITQTNQEVAAGTVKDNKVVKSILLENFESLIKDEADKQIELYYRCSYKTENVEFPRTPSDYLKVKGMPKIIIVNGQWNIAAKAPFGLGEYAGPTQPKKPYWVNGFDNESKEYFNEHFKINAKQTLNGKKLNANELEQKKYILYYDGSSNYAGDMSGQDRFAAGKQFAQDNFYEITKGLGGQDVFFVSHSEGGAYAAGMADYLHSKGIKIGEHVLLSPDEGDEFNINPAIPSYQLLYMFFSTIYNPLGSAIKPIKFKRWGDYYAVVDWVVNEHHIKGIKKMGIAHYQDAGWGGVHGFTNGYDVFDKVSDLKEVKTSDAIGEYDKKPYSGKDQTQTTNGTKFYRINDEYIVFNCPPIVKI